MAKSNLRLVSPESELRTVALRRPSNRDMGRDREHLRSEVKPDEGGQRQPPRPARCDHDPDRFPSRPGESELCDLQWSSIAFETGIMHVRRAKGARKQHIPFWRCESSSTSQPRPSSSPRNEVVRLPRPLPELLGAQARPEANPLIHRRPN